MSLYFYSTYFVHHLIIMTMRKTLLIVTFLFSFSNAFAQFSSNSLLFGDPKGNSKSFVRIDGGDLLFYDQGFTVEGVFCNFHNSSYSQIQYIYSFSDNGYVINSNPSINIYIDELGNLTAEYYMGNYVGDYSTVRLKSTNYDFRDSKVHHFAFARDLNTFELFIDGNLTVSAESFTKDNDFGRQRIILLGAETLNGDYSFYGVIKEIRFWNSVRTANEIKAYFDKPIPSPDLTDNLLGYWKCDVYQQEMPNETKRYWPYTYGRMGLSEYDNQYDPSNYPFACNIGCSKPQTASIIPSTFSSNNINGQIVLNAPNQTDYSYQWKNNGQDIPSATGSSYTPPAGSGNYTVAVSNSCGSAQSQSYFVLSNVEPIRTTGYTNVETTVGENGEAIASVKLNLPKGTFVQPSLSIDYNSQAGNGLLGMGMILSGSVQAITRIAPTLEQDGFTRGISFDQVTDRYALNGERLKATFPYNSIDNYLQYSNSGEFKTEQESFNRVIPHVTYHTGYGWLADSFTVYTKDGLMMEFGFTPDSKIEAPGTTDKVYAWLLNKVYDRNGNYYTVSYTEDNANGEYRVAQILYTGNTTKAVVPYNRISFVYADRPDVVTKYVAGYGFKTTKLLSEILVFDHEQMYRDYKLSYVSEGITTKLIKIDEIGTDGKTALKPVSFEWQNAGGLQVNFTKPGSGNWTGHGEGNTSNILGDFNGDGKTDIASYQWQAKWEVSLSTGNNFVTSIWFANNVSTAKNIAGDFNGDGKTDLTTYDGNGNWQVSLSTGSSFITSIWYGSFPGPDYTYKYAGDFNGDGATDIAAYAGNGNWDVYISSRNGFTTSTWTDIYNEPTNGQSIVTDLNGDGKADILRYYSGAQWVADISTGSGFESSYWNGNGGDINNNILGDFNGDGLGDITRSESGGWWNMCVSPGAWNFNCLTGWNADPSATTNSVTGDFNKDGLSDLAAYTGNGMWAIYLSTGSSFYYAGLTAIHSGGTSNNFIGDFDGDGAGDFITYNGGNSWYVGLANSTKSFVSNVVNGNGQHYSFTYKPITDISVYSKGSAGAYPDLDFIAPMYVVSNMETDNGIGGVHEFDFKYADGKVNLRGRGYRGFGKVTRIDSLSNSTLITWYNTDYKCVAARPIRAELRTLDGKLLNLNINTVGLTRTGFNNDTVCFSYYSKTEEYNYEINGALITSKITSYTYDSYGNPTAITEAYNDTLSISTTNTYTNNTIDWILGRLTAATVTKSQPGKLSITKNSTFKYNSKGFLIQDILLPNDSKFKKQTDYTLDAFGNRTQIKVSGIGITTRAQINTYDADGRFMIQTKNPLGHLSKVSYKIGLPATTTDADKRITSITRDVFGREIKTAFPDGTYKTTSYNDCSTNPGCPVNAKWYMQEQTSGGPVKKTYFDLLDRNIRTETESFSTDNILKDVLYNNDGTVNYETEPYFSSAGTVNKTSYTYDEIKRPITKTEPGNRVTQIQYNGLTITEINPQNQKTTKTTNAEGKLASVTDNLGSKIVYGYDVDLNLTSITDPNGNKIITTYDLLGNKASMTDPDLGTYTYQYNCLGLLTSQANAKGETSNYQYDVLNRMTVRIEPEGSTYWTYDTANAKGQVASIKYSSGNYEKYNYNSAGKISSVTYIRGSKTRIESYTYNATNGLLEQRTQPNGVILKNIYTSKGYLQSVTGTGIKASTITLWTANSYDQNNMLTSYTLGNGLINTKVYDALTHYLTAIKTGKGSVLDSVQNLSFSYSAIGNLTRRKDLKFGLQENFKYDNLNRLTQAQVTGQAALKTSYDKLGNITFKSDVGTYKYGENGAGPHTLTSIDNSTADSCVYGFNEQVTYTSYNYASKITNANTEIAFQYGPSREREVMTVKKNGKTMMIKNYYGGLYEEVTDSAGNTSYNYYVKAGDAVVAIIYSPNTNVFANSKISYLLTDHLGSIYGYTDESGKTTERVSYNAWGQQRNPLTWAVFKTPQGLPSFQRGFTFHEMLDIDFLVCMNARVYNPVLGRFISPDPYIQFPDNLQSLNRYAYALNNPLSFTDPSGYFLGGLFKFLKKNVSTVVSIAVIAATGGTSVIFSTVLGSTFLGAVASGAVIGFGASFTSAIVNGGSIDMAFKAGVQGGLWGGISAGAAFGIGSAFEKGAVLSKYNDFDAPKALLHGVSQGEISELQGGDFRSGFLGGFTGELSATYFKADGIMALVAGGTVSKLSGGSFANGAITAAFVAMYNDGMHQPNEDYEPPSPYLVGAAGIVVGLSEFPIVLIGGTATIGLFLINPDALALYDLGLYDGMELSIDEALNAASKFLGENYTGPISRSGGSYLNEYISEGGSRVVRFDLESSKPNFAPHLNFQTYQPRNPITNLKPIETNNFHIYVPE